MNHFYPGMGATSSMYGATWREAFEGEFHDWPKWQGELSLTDFAERIIDEHQIVSGDTIIGTSLGGIIACEISNTIELERVVLIGSAKKKEEISRILEVLHPLVDLAPLPFIKIASGKLPSDLCMMFSDSEPAFIRNMSKAIFSWSGIQNEVPITRIHGTKDRVIPHPNDVDYTINGGHLIVMTHPTECINKIECENRFSVR